MMIRFDGMVQRRLPGMGWLACWLAAVPAVAPAVGNNAATPSESGSILAPVTAEIVDAGDVMPLLTARQAVDMARARDSGIRLAKQRVERLRAEAAGIEGWRDPQIRAEHDRVRRVGELDTLREDESGELALRVYTPHVWSRPATRREARARVVEQQIRVEEIAQDVEYRIMSLLLDVIYLEKKWLMQGRIVQSYSLRRDHQANLLDAGESTPFQVIQQDMRYAEAVAGRGRTLSDWLRRIAELRRLTGIQAHAEQPLIKRSFEEIVGFTDMQEAALIDHALRRRPEVRAVEYALASDRARYEAHRRKSMPWFEYVQISYQQGSLGSPDDETWSLQAAVGLPVVTALQARDRGASAAALRETEALVDHQRAVIVNDVEESYASFRTALAYHVARRHAADRLTNQIRQTKAETIAALGAEHLEILRLREQLAELELSLLETEYDARRAALALRRAAGLLEDQ